MHGDQVGLRWRRQLVRSYAPKSFSRIRTVLGLGYESFARTLDNMEVFFQSGHFFFSNR